jgi:hypothetical protein
MERARRVRLLIAKAKDVIEKEGDRREAVQAMEEAIELLRKIEADMTKFRDLLAQ